MSPEEINLLFSQENNEVLEAHKEIVAIQKDKSSILIFDKPWLDDNLVGGINNKICFFGSRPGNGKTYHCSETINALLDITKNNTPIEICRFNLEMPTLSLLLQQTSRVLKKTPKEILEQPYSEEEKPIVTDIVNSFMDKRIKNISKVLIGEDFENAIKKFCSDVDLKDPTKKTKKVVLIDHIHVYKNKEQIDDILLRCNALKMADKNLSFIIYFQLRRDVEDLWRDTKDRKVNPKNLLPNSTYIYLSDILQQVADIVVAMVIPQNYDLEEYASVNKERNKHLEPHFIDDITSDNSYVKLKGRNRIFYNFIKIRLLNSFDDARLHCEILNPSYEKTLEKSYKKHQSITPNFDTAPTFSVDLTKHEQSFESIKDVFK